MKVKKIVNNYAIPLITFSILNQLEIEKTKEKAKKKKDKFRVQ